MEFKYYHGTSTIFLESIRKTGLGAINPNFDLKNLDVLRFLYGEAKSNHLEDEEFMIWEDSIRATIFQTDLIIGDQKLNYRHDGMYVAISRERAVIYACLNKYGSEVLEKCLMLLQVLKRHNVSITIPSDINLFGIVDYVNAEPKPILIEIQDISDEDLEKEDGKTAPEALKFLRNTIPILTEKQKFEFLQFCNFKLLKPVPFNKLKFFEIDFEGHPKTNNFRYYLSRI